MPTVRTVVTVMTFMSVGYNQRDGLGRGVTADLQATDSEMSRTTHVTQPTGQEARSQPSDGSGQQKKGGDGEGTLVVPKPHLDLNTQLGFRLAIT